MNTQFEKTRARLNELAHQLAAGSAPEAPDEWGGADVMICAKPPKTPSEPSFYPEPRTVVTPHSRHLTWLFYQLRDAFYDQELLDSMTKIEFFGRLANAALRYQSRCGGTEISKELLLAVLHEAFAVLDELEEGTFECLAIAFGNTIADDFIEREEKRGFIGVEETKKFFAERGIRLP
jgi:hypothetical protein